MANPEWGTKRVCQSCAAKFYDLKREPIVCPKCKTVFDPEAFLRTRRGRTASGNVDKDQSVTTASDTDTEIETDDPELLDDEDDAAATSVEGDDEEEDLIEDASELGEDDDDMAEVIENVGEEEDR